MSSASRILRKLSDPKYKTRQLPANYNRAEEIQKILDNFYANIDEIEAEYIKSHTKKKNDS